MIQYFYEIGISSLIYRLFFFLGYVGVLLIDLYMGKKHNIPVWKVIVFTLTVYIGGFALMYLLAWAETGFKSFGANNIVRIFVYMPLIAIVVCKIMKLDVKVMCDCIAPCICINHGIAHLGCIFAGCCHGYPCSFGYYNPMLGVTTFPIQLIEALFALLIVVVLLIIAKKDNYRGRGWLYPLMLVLYGSTRFAFEFLRDNTKILFGCSALSFHALFMAIVGAVWLIIIKKRSFRNENIKPEGEN